MSILHVSSAFNLDPSSVELHHRSWCDLSLYKAKNVDNVLYSGIWILSVSISNIMCRS